jgi:hypothetical protein
MLLAALYPKPKYTYKIKKEEERYNSSTFQEDQAQNA